MAKLRKKKVKDLSGYSGAFHFKVTVWLDPTKGDFFVEEDVFDRNGVKYPISIRASTLQTVVDQVREWSRVVDDVDWKPAILYRLLTEGYREQAKFTGVSRTTVLIDPSKMFEKTKANYVLPFRQEDDKTMVFFIGENDDAIALLDSYVTLLRDIQQKMYDFKNQTAIMTAHLSRIAQSEKRTLAGPALVQRLEQWLTEAPPLLLAENSVDVTDA